MIPQPIDQVPLFLRLSEEERELVTARLRRRSTQPDEVVFSSGRPSDAFFIVASGWIKLESSDSKSALANLGPGSLIGEIDTLLGRPYSVTAKSSGKAQLLTLSRLDIEDLITLNPGIGLKFSASLGMRIEFLEQYLVQQRLRGIDLLSGLAEEDLRAIADKLDFRAFERGDMFVEAGEPGDAVFFIEDGQVRLITESSEGDSFEELAQSAMFGHTALITGKPYPWNARAVSDISLWILTRASYQELVVDHPAIKFAFTRALEEPLSPADQGEAMDKMRELPLLSDIPTEALTALVARLVLRHFPANEVVYAEGTPGDALYIVETGEVRLFDSAFSDAQLLERIRAGETFGEMALLTGRTRAECARAGSDTTIWVLYRSDFDDLMVQYPEISVSLSRALSERLKSRESDFVERHLQRIDLLQGLARSEVKQIASKVRGLRFRPSETICYAGQPAEHLFMIERGEVKRTAGDARGEETIVDILAPGDSFGEQVVIRNGIYNTTAQANEDTEIWTISRVDFSKLMEQYPALGVTATKLMGDRLAKAQGIQMPRRVPQMSPTGRPLTRVPLHMPHVNMPHVNMPRVQMPHVNVPHVQMPHLQRPVPGARPVQAVPGPAARRQPARPLVKQSVPLTQTNKAVPPPPQAKTERQGAFLKEIGPWIADLSIGGKFRFLALTLLMIWMLVIALPATAFTSISSAVAGIQLSNPSAGANSGQTSSSSSRPGFDFPLKFALFQPSLTPKPTATPIPSPTTRAVVISAPRPQPTVAPPVAPAVAAPAVPALPPIDFDSSVMGPTADAVLHPDLQGIRIMPAAVGHGQKFWRITSVKWEKSDDHSIYVKTFGEDGKRVSGVKVRMTSTGGLNEFYDTKINDPVCDCDASYAMFGDGYRANIEDQYPSEKIVELCMCGIPNVFPHKAHVTYHISFQLVTNP